MLFAARNSSNSSTANGTTPLAMANDTAMVNGSEKSNNSDANMSNMMANGQDQSLKVMKNSAMSNGVSYSANRTESYSNSRTTRRK